MSEKKEQILEPQGVLAIMTLPNGHVEATLVAVVTRIGRPCTIEEITEAWGRLRDRRSSPLPSDLATIIAAKDRRTAKMAKRAKLSPDFSAIEATAVSR